MPQTCQLGTKEIFYSSRLVHFLTRGNEAVRCNTGSSQNLSIRCNFIFSRGRTHIQGLHIVHIVVSECRAFVFHLHILQDRKSTRLNSSHVAISYAVFCLKKKRKKK